MTVGVLNPSASFDAAQAVTPASGRRLQSESVTQFSALPASSVKFGLRRCGTSKHRQRAAKRG